MSTALLLWIFHLTLSDDRKVYLVYLVESPLRACKAEDAASVAAMLFSVDFDAKMHLMEFK